MVWPPYDFTARHPIDVNGVRGYNPGDGMYAQVVDDLGLVIGVDVDAARPDIFELPVDSAPRARWLEYALAQDQSLTRDEADDMTRADLIARVTKPEPSETAADLKSAKKAQPKT